MKTTGEVIGIIANLVTVKVFGPVSQNEICYILMDDGVRLMAEVIKVIGDRAYVQVFESTRGLKGERGSSSRGICWKPRWGRGS